MIEYNIWNIFFEKAYTKYVWETIPRLFSKDSKLSISLDQYSKVLYGLLLLHAKLRTIEICWNQAVDHSLLLQKKLFKKTKSGLERLYKPHFLHDFQRKVFFLLYSINWPNFNVWLPLTHEILGNIYTVIAC